MQPNPKLPRPLFIIHHPLLQHPARGACTALLALCPVTDNSRTKPTASSHAIASNAVGSSVVSAKKPTKSVP